MTCWMVSVHPSAVIPVGTKGSAKLDFPLKCCGRLCKAENGQCGSQQKETEQT